MNSRYPILGITVAVLAITIAVDVLYPAYETIVFYGLLFWLVGSFFFFRGPGWGRPTPGGAGGPSTAGPSSANPLSPGSPPPSGPPVALAFCAFCGGSLPEDATKCPACKHAVRSF